MKVGNSLTLVLPKVLINNYKIKKGKKLKILCTENGIIIQVKKRSNEKVKKHE
jgi:antitoxin component of MazEF toxin-antitoxin module